MSRSEDVLIDCEQSLNDVAVTLGRIFDTEPEPDPDDGFVFRLSDTARAWLFAETWSFDPRLEGFDFDLETSDAASRIGPDDNYAAQEATARRVFNLIADNTPWRLALLFNGFGTDPEVRDAKTAA